MMRARKVLDGTLEARDRNKIQDFTILFICFFWRQQLNALCTDHFPTGIRLVHSHLSRSYITALSLVESFPSDAGASNLMP